MSHLQPRQLLTGLFVVEGFILTQERNLHLSTSLVFQTLKLTPFAILGISLSKNNKGTGLTCSNCFSPRCQITFEALKMVVIPEQLVFVNAPELQLKETTENQSEL